jgi:hypothetical protein
MLVIVLLLEDKVRKELPLWHMSNYLDLLTVDLQMSKLALACTAYQMAASQGRPAALTTNLVHQQEYMD